MDDLSANSLWISNCLPACYDCNINNPKVISFSNDDGKARFIVFLFECYSLLSI